MGSDKEDLLHINPVKNYETPQMPTLENAHRDSSLLKKLPSRWKKNATVVTSIGIMGTMTLTGCSLFQEGDTINVTAQQTIDFDFDMHHGGSGPAPVYVVYLTEQEALNIIRTQLESAGLNFNASPPEYKVDLPRQNLSLNLFDESKGIAVAFADSGLFEWESEDFVKLATEEFAQKTALSVGVFYNPKIDEWTGANAKDAEDMLIAQVQEFISFLQNEGILAPTDPITSDNISAQVEREELNLTAHHGGGGGAPIYIVHLTEQEAFGIIRAQLESYGLHFNANPPGYTFDSWSDQRIGIDLFDEDKGVAITHISWEESNQHFRPRGSAFAEEVANSFREQTNDISIGVFYNPGEAIYSGAIGGHIGLNDEEIATRKAEARPVLEARLAAQTREFIAYLQSEGIITSAQTAPEISVILNGAPLEFDTAPIVVSDRTMVPFRAIFEALGMEVAWDNDTQTAIGTREGLKIELPIGATTAFVNGEAIELEVPAMLHNERTLVPIRFIAESSGAIVHWDDSARAVIITTD